MSDGSHSTPPAGALVEIASALSSSAQSGILRRWQEGIRQITPALDEKTQRELESFTIETLNNLMAAAPVQSTAAPEQVSLTVNQWFSHFKLLRSAVLLELPASLNRELKPEETVAVNQAIDDALNRVAGALAMRYADKLQVETAAMAKFLSFLSHDLRGGLNAAVLMIEVLRRQLANDPKFAGSVEDLNVVRRSVLDTVEIMERFVAAERLRMGKFTPTIEPFDVGQLVGEVRKRVAPDLSIAGMELRVAVREGLMVNSDRRMIGWVVQNLVSNAIKFARSGEVTIAAQVDGGAAEGSLLELCVSDNGPGIAPARLEEIFQSLRRGESYGQKGVGLGLYVAYHVAVLLNGKLWAESTVGQGARFWLELPMAASQDPRA